MANETLDTLNAEMGVIEDHLIENSKARQDLRVEAKELRTLYLQKQEQREQLLHPVEEESQGGDE